MVQPKRRTSSSRKVTPVGNDLPCGTNAGWATAVVVLSTAGTLVVELNICSIEIFSMSAFWLAVLTNSTLICNFVGSRLTCHNLQRLLFGW